MLIWISNILGFGIWMSPPIWMLVTYLNAIGIPDQCMNHLTTKQFKDQTTFDHLNIRKSRYSDSRCIWTFSLDLYSCIVKIFWLSTSSEFKWDLNKIKFTNQRPDTGVRLMAYLCNFQSNFEQYLKSTTFIWESVTCILIGVSLYKYGVVSYQSSSRHSSMVSTAACYRWGPGFKSRQGR